MTHQTITTGGTSAVWSPPPDNSEVVEETYEYDEKGRLTKKTVKRTTVTPSPTLPYRYPQIWYSHSALQT